MEQVFLSFFFNAEQSSYSMGLPKDSFQKRDRLVKMKYIVFVPRAAFCTDSYA